MDNNPNRRMRRNGRSSRNPAEMFGNPSGKALEERMARTRRNNAQLHAEASFSPGGGVFGPNGDAVQMATGRPRDPMFYWRQNNLPFDFTKPAELRKIREFCSDPAELVWMGDYSFKPIGEVQIGDEVISWTKPEAGQKSRLVRSTVLATNRRIAPETVKITTEAGRTWTGTPDHRFANPYFSPGHINSTDKRNDRNAPIAWRQPEFVNPVVGKQLRHIIDPTQPLASEKEREVAAWLGGIYDGEGCGEGIGQSITHNPDVYARIQDSLDFLNLPHVDSKESIFIRTAGSRKPAKKPLVDLLNWGNVTRRKTNAIDKRMLTRVSGSTDRIVSSESMGPGEVVSLQTSEGTYIVSGFASYNCRLLYMTHPLIAACVDIYSKLPLQGMEIKCLAGETMVQTDIGMRRIDSLSGENHTILTTGGKWVDAKFDEFGVQKLQKLTLTKNRRTKVIYATPEHRWFVVKNNGTSDLRVEVPTSDLQVGAKLTSTYARNVVLNNVTPSPFGIAHGAVYGDGSMNYSSKRGAAFIDLHGKKDIALLPYFIGAKTAQYEMAEGRNVPSIRVKNLPRAFKRLPDIDESLGYLYGWLAGYFAADGTVSQHNEMYLDSADRDSIEFAQTVCQLLGIRTNDIYTYTIDKKLPNGNVIEDWTGYRLPIDIASVDDKFFIVEEHLKRWIASNHEKRRVENWTVVSVEDTDRLETVYCAVVPETEAFVIEGNILTGNCKDEDLVEFYTNLFFDQLNYEDHLTKMGRQYWLSGETFSLGAWNEDLGIWEDEQIINPDDVEVESSLFISQPRFLMRLPESLRKILTERSPVYEYNQLMKEYPELSQFTGEDDLMPVSNFIMHQIRFEADDFSNRGISILMRALRTIIQEEMLMTALDAIADRLYTPLIIAKLGASATDLGTQAPWIPTAEQKAEFGMAMDAALAADFRVLITHFATDVESVFGRENVPDLSNDFDRIGDRILMAFGLSKTMLSGANEGETYAADALNRDVVTQLLTHYQRKLKLFFHERAEIVAEAQGHFDYEVRNGERYLVTEEIWEVDEETGEGQLLEQPKLLIPTLDFKIMNLTDEQAEAEFIESLAQTGVPIPQRIRIRTTGIDFDEMREMRKQEIVQLAIDEQEARRETYKALVAAGLPIPDDLKKDFAPVAMMGPGAQGDAVGGASDVAIPQMGMNPQTLPNMAPTPDDIAGDQMAAGQQMDQQETNEETDPAAQLPQPGDDVPPESNEQRGRMPKPASVNKKTAAFKKIGRRAVMAATLRHYKEPDNSDETSPSNYQPSGKFGAPKHIGMRRYVKIPEELIYREED